MATSTYLSNTSRDRECSGSQRSVHGATVNINYDQLEATAFGDSSRKYVSGLGAHSVTLDFYASFAATETWATLKSLVGTSTTVIVKPATGADSATNPGLTFTGSILGCAANRVVPRGSRNHFGGFQRRCLHFRRKLITDRAPVRHESEKK
jgi:hypothetical protein